MQPKLTFYLSLTGLIAAHEDHLRNMFSIFGDFFCSSRLMLRNEASEYAVHGFSALLNEPFNMLNHTKSAAASHFQKEV